MFGCSRAGRAGAVSGLAVLAVGAAVASAAGPAFPGAPHSQRFRYGSRCPAAPANPYLTSPAGCLSVRFADVDGDGKSDLVLLYTKPGVRNISYSFTLKVYRASGGVLTARVPEGDIPATISRTRNVTGARGAELFIHFVHVTTFDSMALYSFDGSTLRRAGELRYGGYDNGIRYGFTCRTAGAPTVVADSFTLTAAPRTWTDTATTYRWSGAVLKRSRTTSTTLLGSPPHNKVGMHC